jgi:Ulp1 protease family, C-terminal catalytic domain
MENRIFSWPASIYSTQNQENTIIFYGNIFSLKMMYFPINIRHKHWILVVVDVPTRKIVYYDSYNKKGLNGKRYTEYMLNYLLDKYKRVRAIKVQGNNAAPKDSGKAGANEGGDVMPYKEGDAPPNEGGKAVPNKDRDSARIKDQATSYNEHNQDGDTTYNKDGDVVHSKCEDTMPNKDVETAPNEEEDTAPNKGKDTAPNKGGDAMPNTTPNKGSSTFNEQNNIKAIDLILVTICNSTCFQVSTTVIWLPVVIDPSQSI